MNVFEHYRLRQVSGEDVFWWALSLAGISTIFTLCITAFLILEHLTIYIKPEEQKWIISCIFMVPLYAACSLLSLWEPSLDLVSNLMRECYEAYTLYSFSMYLIACLGGEQKAVEKMLRHRSAHSTTIPSELSSNASAPLLEDSAAAALRPSKTEAGSPPSTPFSLSALPSFTPSASLGVSHSPSTFRRQSSRGSKAGDKEGDKLGKYDDGCEKGGEENGEEMDEEEMEHPWPLNLLISPWRLGPEFYVNCKFGIVQYLVLKTMCALLELLLDYVGKYGQGQLDWSTGYPYMTIVMNFSQMWALYCVVEFFHVFWVYLLPIKPLGKLVLIKSVIFVTWWQSVLLALPYALGLVHPPKEDITNGILFQNAVQDFLTAMEMSVAAITSLYIFPADPYRLLAYSEGVSVDVGKVAVLGNMADMRAPMDPDEVMASESIGLLPRQLPTSTRQANVHTKVADSIRDVLYVGGELVAKDFRETVNIAVEPVERGFSAVNIRIHDTFDSLQNMTLGGMRVPKNGQTVRDDCFAYDWLSTNPRHAPFSDLAYAHRSKSALNLAVDARLEKGGQKRGGMQQSRQEGSNRQSSSNSTLPLRPERRMAYGVDLSKSTRSHGHSSDGHSHRGSNSDRESGKVGK